MVVNLHGPSDVHTPTPGPNPRLTSIEDTAYVLQSACPEVLLEWASPDGYPWGIHANSSRMNLPYQLERFAGDADTPCLWVRSMTCTGLAGTAQAKCAPCRSVKVGRILETRAQSAAAHNPYQYLTHSQLVDALWEMTAEKNEQTLKNLNMARKVSRSTSRMSDQKRLIMAIATSDSPRLNSLMRVAIKQRTLTAVCFQLGRKR
ncbi:hypothetical protein DFH07DRAFT_965361 [Mycena maculata]|uniref:Uncharacterized protein n=1 Tax=Mycena maculata TaxID=230809 RepID=A0AAD7IFA8_9AGAR|nr:hypothetical protein DFH07DRAFT_965361 [Mycena maculata]